jgi:hypothetical protein
MKKKKKYAEPNLQDLGKSGTPKSGKVRFLHVDKGIGPRKLTFLGPDHFDPIFAN